MLEVKENGRDFHFLRGAYPGRRGRMMILALEALIYALIVIFVIWYAQKGKK